MILRYYGHSLFTLALESGLTLATDPYGDFYQYPKRILHADMVTISHPHHDHNAVSMIAGKPRVVDREGYHLLAPDLTVTGIPSKHDQFGGAKLGDNLIFAVEAEGLRIVHLGDLGQPLTQAQIRAIGTPDVLLIPVGGNYTIDAALAVQSVRQLRPHVTIPMHYRTKYNEEISIETELPFLSLMGQYPEPLPLCRLTREDLSERPSLLRLEISAQGST